MNYNTIDKYFKLIEERPEEFLNNDELLTIVKDRKAMEEFSKKHGIQLGVVYESKYHFMIVDLVKNKNGCLFSYERIINAVPGGSVIVTLHNNKFVLLKQYRHTLRDFQYAFPRGFKESGISDIENAKKEISEELNNTTINYTHIGKVVADSGLSGNLVDVYKCEIIDNDVKLSETEGISSTLELSECELKKMIEQDLITDGFTLSAFILYLSKTSLNSL